MKLQKYRKLYSQESKDEVHIRSIYSIYLIGKGDYTPSTCTTAVVVECQYLWVFADEGDGALMLIRRQVEKHVGPSLTLNRKFSNVKDGKSEDTRYAYAPETTTARG